MIKRTISVGKPARISLRDNQVLFWFIEDEREVKVPVEDIGFFVLDHPRITISHGAINALISNNAAILWCDEKHLPNGLVLPMAQNSVYAEKVTAQLAATVPLKKQLWKQTVVAKINNQAAVLKLLGKPYKVLLGLKENVRSGDPDNIEAWAARRYWKELFAEIGNFTRGRYEDSPNNLLNYGYAILRGVVARALASTGCIPAVGIFHHNKYNAFCLADDMMESYRPYVDLLVLDIVKENGELPEELDKEHKAALLQIPAMDVVIDGNSSPLMNAVQRTTASLMKCYEGESRKLLLPTL